MNTEPFIIGSPDAARCSSHWCGTLARALAALVLLPTPASAQQATCVRAPTLRLDHAIVVVRDLHAAQARFAPDSRSGMRWLLARESLVILPMPPSQRTPRLVGVELRRE